MSTRFPTVESTSSDSVTFGEYAEEWFDGQVRLMRAGLLPGNSIRRYESNLASWLLPFFAAYPLDEITRERVEAFQAALAESDTVGPLTINHTVRLLGMILRRAIQARVMRSPDPMWGIRPLWPPKRTVDCFSPAETRALLAATDEGYRAMVGLAVLGGLRRGEIFGLGVDDVDLEAGVIRVRRSVQAPNRMLTAAQRLRSPKTPAGRREVPIRGALSILLDSYLQELTVPNEFGLVFSGDPPPFVNAYDLRERAYWPALRKAGLRRLSFHDLRITFITHCAEAGIPLPVIGRWVGHSTARVTEYYIHATRQGTEDAIALLNAYDGEHGD